MNWSSVIAILETIWNALTPTLKPIEIAELEALKLKYAGNPAILALIGVVESLVNSVP